MLYCIYIRARGFLSGRRRAEGKNGGEGSGAGTPVLPVRVWDVHSQKPAKLIADVADVGSPLASPRLATR